MIVKFIPIDSLVYAPHLRDNSAPMVQFTGEPVRLTDLPQMGPKPFQNAVQMISLSLQDAPVDSGRLC